MSQDPLQSILHAQESQPDLDKLAKNCRRSVARGLSPRKRSEPFDFDQVMGLSDRVGFFNLNILRAPFSPFAMTTFATFFLVALLPSLNNSKSCGTVLP